MATTASTMIWVNKFYFELEFGIGAYFNSSYDRYDTKNTDLVHKL